MNHIWVTSDWHINHGETLMGYTGRPSNYAELILENLKTTVKEGDTLINLGDVIFYGASELKQYLGQIKGTKILVRGNHDVRHGDNWFHERGFDVVCESIVIKNILFTHEPKDHFGKAMGNCSGHLHNRGGNTPNVHIVSPHHYLISVEWTNYQPVNFDTIQAALLKNYRTLKQPPDKQHV